MNGLPGIEVVFRDHKRLAYKLTKDEMKAIQSYIEGRVLQEQNEVLFRTNFMQSEYDSNIRQMKERVVTLEKELEFKSQLLDQYKTSDNNLATVHKNREERLEHRQSKLLIDLGQNQDAIKEMNVAIYNLRNELGEKEKTISEQGKEIEDLHAIIKRHEEIEDASKQNEQLSQEILKVKIEIDSKDKIISKLQQEKQNLIQQNGAFQNSVREAEKKIQNLRSDVERQTQVNSSKHEQILRLQIQLENERRKSLDSQRELTATKIENGNGNDKNGVVGGRVRFQNGYTVQNGYQKVSEKRNENFEELLRERNETLRKELLLIESRVKLLEEKISLYRNQSRDMNEESLEISENANKMSQLYEKIYVHGTTLIEKLLQDLQDSINSRKSRMETAINDLLKQAPAVVSRDVCDIRADVLALKKQAEQAKVNDVIVRASRLLARLGVCEKTKFSARIFSESKNQNLKRSVTKIEDTKDKEQVFTVRKPPNIPALSRPKQQNIASQQAWKRKHSVSMDTGTCLSPTLIDLSISSPTSPRDTRTKVFFGLPGSLPQNDKGFDRKAFSDPIFRTDY